MRRRSEAMAMGLLAAVLAGCGGGGEPVTEEVPRVQPEWAIDQPLPYWPGPPTLLRTQAELDAVWITAMPDFSWLPVTMPSRQPPVDFATHALAWVPGSLPDSCPIFGIRKITRRGFDYTIEWGYQFPGPNTMCLLVASSALSLALLPQPVNTATFLRRDVCYSVETGTFETCT